MYLHGVSFAQWHERVALGTAKHENSYRRDHSIDGLFGLAPDRIDWKNHVVYEHKGSGGAVEAVDDQVAFYALMLSLASGVTWQGVAHILTTRRNRTVPLDAAQLERLWNASVELEQLSLQPKPPPAQRIGICPTCSLAQFCGYDT